MSLNKILWTIDSELDPRSFERLATDLLYRNGYREIEPIEPQDGGRDAEEYPRRGRGRHGNVCFFQFSLRDDWKTKLREDAERLDEREYEFETLVYVTSQKARGIDRDRLSEGLWKKYGWDLVIFSREWLRLQLEEAHPDLARKYLSVEVSRDTPELLFNIGSDEELEEELSTVFELLKSEEPERAASRLKQFVGEHPESSQAWHLRAVAQYQLHRYDEAITSLNRASQVGLSRKKLRLIRACTLTEKGISENNRTAIQEGCEGFREIVEEKSDPSWADLYNLGNALSALGQAEEAIEAYEKALDKSEQPSLLKNLGSAYHQVDDHEAEMECFNRALELEPTKPEALISKGISLLIDFDKPDQAATFLERGVKHNPEWITQNPATWYWLGLSNYRAERFQESLEWINRGLAHQPGHEGLTSLKSDVLAQLIETKSEVNSDARQFWQRRLESDPRFYDTRARLIRLESMEDNIERAWDLIDECLKLAGIDEVSLRDSGFSIDQCIRALWFFPQYTKFRQSTPVAKYWNEDHNLYDLGYPAPEEEQVQQALRTFLAVPFGLGMKYSVEENTVSVVALGSLQQKIYSLVEEAVSAASRPFAHSFTSDLSNEETSERLTEIMLFMALVALREASAEYGWIASRLSVSKKKLHESTKNFSPEDIHDDTVTSVLKALNEELGLFPDKR